MAKIPTNRFALLDPDGADDVGDTDMMSDKKNQSEKKVSRSQDPYYLTLDDIVDDTPNRQKTDNDVILEIEQDCSPKTVAHSTDTNVVTCTEQEHEHDVTEGSTNSPGSTDQSVDEFDKYDMTELRRRYNVLIKTHRHKFTRDLVSKLWESWRAVVPAIPGSYAAKLAQLRNFVVAVDQTELILHDRAPRSRFEYHSLCTMLRLEHTSIETEPKRDDPNEFQHNEGWRVVGGRHKKQQDVHHPKQYIRRPDREDEEKEKLKTMIIRKPENWCWEFTSLTPYQKFEIDRNLKDRVSKHRSHTDYLRTQHCVKCNASAVSTGLYSADTINGLYCEICKNSPELSEHRFRHEIGRSFY